MQKLIIPLVQLFIEHLPPLIERAEKHGKPLGQQKTREKTRRST